MGDACEFKETATKIDGEENGESDESVSHATTGGNAPRFVD